MLTRWVLRARAADVHDARPANTDAPFRATFRIRARRMPIMLAPRELMLVMRSGQTGLELPLMTVAALIPGPGLPGR